MTTPSATSASDLSVPTWRHGLRKTPSSSVVNEVIAGDNGNLPRSASSPRIALDSRLDAVSDPYLTNLTSIYPPIDVPMAIYVYLLLRIDVKNLFKPRFFFLCGLCLISCYFLLMQTTKFSSLS